MTALFPPLSNESSRLINRLPGLIEKVFPLPGRFRAGLPRDVAELSRLFTADRTERNNSYLGRPAAFSAYLRYFLPWNVYRLSRLFTALPLNLQSGGAVNDFGAGPLTLAIALWISRPDLRNVPLEFRCVDRTAAILEAGKKLFAALAADGASGSSGSCPWIIKTIRGELKQNGGLSAEIRGKPAALSAAVNVYNELFWDFSPRDTERLKTFAARQARLLSSLTENSGSVLAVEPGIPRSGEFISLLRASLINEGRPPLAPCVHSGPCPLPGGQIRAGTRWCHFAFDTEDAPETLRKLSAAAMIPKERAVIGFILAGPVAQKTDADKKGRFPAGNDPAAFDGPKKIRVVSDSFPVGGNRLGRYGCGESGLVLVSGNRAAIEASPSGTLEELPLEKDLKDAKSGAFIAVKKSPGL